MKTLEEEAKEYERHLKHRLSSKELTEALMDFTLNSKWVQAENIKARIDALEDVRNSDTIFWVDSKIEKLEQQLKQLEDE